MSPARRDCRSAAAPLLVPTASRSAATYKTRARALTAAHNQGAGHTDTSRVDRGSALSLCTIRGLPMSPLRSPSVLLSRSLRTGLWPAQLVTLCLERRPRRRLCRCCCLNLLKRSGSSFPDTDRLLHIHFIVSTSVYD